MGRKKQWMGVVMKIQVTQEDISNGKTNIYACPIALSLRREFPSAKVGVAITLDGSWKDAIQAPPEALKFMNDFDDGKSVKPFEFELDI